MSKELSLINEQTLAKSGEIDSLVTQFHESNLSGFQLALATAKYMGQLREMINDDYLKEILPLQGAKLGYRTDKQYESNIVKDCLIEATLTGLQPVGNQWNIIGGNFYITREGAEYLLSKVSGLSYDIQYDIPEIKNEKSATVKCFIRWKYAGSSNEQEITFPIKANKYLSDDGIIGKAKRKASVWLVNKLKGTNLSDSDLDDRDRDVTALKSKLEITLEKEGKTLNIEEADVALDQVIVDTIENFTSKDELKAYYETLSKEENPLYKTLVVKRAATLK